MIEWCKQYFRGFLLSLPPTMKTGDTMTFGFRYMNKDGTWGLLHIMAVIDKKDL